MEKFSTPSYPPPTAATYLDGMEAGSLHVPGVWRRKPGKALQAAGDVSLSLPSRLSYLLLLQTRSLPKPQPHLQEESPQDGTGESTRAASPPGPKALLLTADLPQKKVLFSLQGLQKGELISNFEFIFYVNVKTFLENNT